MFPKINPTETGAWQQLKQHYEEMKNVSMKKMFQEEADRFSKFSTGIDDFVFDYSKIRK
jgi:glucose-6-phosphate isomerase